MAITVIYSEKEKPSWAFDYKQKKWKGFLLDISRFDSFGKSLKRKRVEYARRADADAAEYSYKFKFLNREFRPIGADKTELARNTGQIEARSYNFLTGKMNIITGDIEVERKNKPRWKTL